MTRSDPKGLAHRTSDFGCMTQTVIAGSYRSRMGARNRVTRVRIGKETTVAVVTTLVKLKTLRQAG